MLFAVDQIGLGEWPWFHEEWCSPGALWMEGCDALASRTLDACSLLFNYKMIDNFCFCRCDKWDWIVSCRYCQCPWRRWVYPWLLWRNTRGASRHMWDAPRCTLKWADHASRQLGIWLWLCYPNDSKRARSRKIICHGTIAWYRWAIRTRAVVAGNPANGLQHKNGNSGWSTRKWTPSWACLSTSWLHLSWCTVGISRTYNNSNINYLPCPP
jgi:hypothetical protein